MGNTNLRLYFIDAIRAWAILMMLQGHFVDGLLDNAFRDNTNIFYSIWKYFRGVTAPVFFTVSGFIFTYLLIKGDKIGFNNPRVKKGIKRGLQLLVIGYLLRLNFFGLLKGQIYSSFYVVDVLHCIGLSILGIIGIYLLTANRNKFLFPSILLIITLVLFVMEPYYKQYSHHYLPNLLANYLTKANGSVFTIMPWFGYASIGAFLSVWFNRFKSSTYLYPVAILSFSAIGALLILYSSSFFLTLSNLTGLALFTKVYLNNYLFIRLGDVFLVFAVFMVFRRFFTNSTLLKIGQSTLSIYVFHFIILYGSFTGLGLYYFLNHSLSPYIVIPGALAFIIVTTLLALKYENNKVQIKMHLATGIKIILDKAASLIGVESLPSTKSIWLKSKLGLQRLFRLVKN
ncbi:heparan-alpha-glucosaminide N-acetyltransferase domain-containing protein [Arenibacter latericius]|uniref:heparan-alpha-glucosaminide N-acetyltransferase domain-containing protein n=1 Tax=Arenibacter latericius TaxID=86104 RepID=UPI0003FEE5D0|nr:heparan-alpha-glucosaminide N-acetyltransferase domain-containing protein [Arenibacter latericius]MDX1364898.1 heparan-alpha-glucosaminide N-acetyltransferase domain-containing protein [Arenibacter latericius]